MKTIVLSDLHIGNPAVNLSKLNKFLFTLQCDRLVLAGDIWDLTTKSASDIKKDHQDIIQIFERLINRGVKIEYILGLSDKNYLDDPILQIPVFRNWQECLPDGRKIAIIHGHQFDSGYKKSWLNWLTLGFLGKRKICTGLNGQSYIDAINKINESAIKRMSNKYDILIMGHTHAPLSCVKSFAYYNSGDWEYHRSYVVIDGSNIALRYAIDLPLHSDRWFRV